MGIQNLFQKSFSEMLYDFAFDGALKPEHLEKADEIGYHGADFVLRLCQYSLKQSGYNLFFDNYFNFLDLLIKLRKIRSGQ